MLPYLGLPKYLQTNGDAVGHPPLAKYLLRPEILAGLFAAAAGLVFLPDDKMKLERLIPAESLAFGVIGVMRYSSDKKYGFDFGSRVIHTQPTQEEIIASSKFQPRCLQYIKDNHQFAGLTCASTLLGIASTSNSHMEWIATSSMYLTYFGSNIYRFNQVAKSEWTIVPGKGMGNSSSHQPPQPPFAFG